MAIIILDKIVQVPVVGETALGGAGRKAIADRRDARAFTEIRTYLLYSGERANRAPPAPRRPRHGRRGIPVVDDQLNQNYLQTSIQPLQLNLVPVMLSSGYREWEHRPFDSMELLSYNVIKFNEMVENNVTTIYKNNYAYHLLQKTQNRFTVYTKRRLLLNLEGITTMPPFNSPLHLLFPVK